VGRDGHPEGGDDAPVLPQVDRFGFIAGEFEEFPVGGGQEGEPEFLGDDGDRAVVVEPGGAGESAQKRGNGFRAEGIEVLLGLEAGGPGQFADVEEHEAVDEGVEFILLGVGQLGQGGRQRVRRTEWEIPR